MSERPLTPEEAGEIIDRLTGEWEESGTPYWMLKDAIRRVKKRVVIDEEESD